MKASKYTEAQKAFILKQGEGGTPVAEICRIERVREIKPASTRTQASYGPVLVDQIMRLE